MCNDDIADPATMTKVWEETNKSKEFLKLKKETNK